MQHHGLPTRLLDWTDTFAVALFFAIRDIPFALGGIKEPEVDCSPVVWILDASELNKQSTFGGAIPEPNSEVSDGYYDYFISEEKSFSDSALAILPPRRGARLASQNGFFTFHSDLSKPLEQFSPKSVMKFELPRSAIPDAGRFLQLAGVNEYSAFPDLDGLARHLRSLHVDIPC